jgi:hypothetical protein
MEMKDILLEKRREANYELLSKFSLEEKILLKRFLLEILE